MQEYLINIEEVNVSNASKVEMFALLSYANSHEHSTKFCLYFLKLFLRDSHAPNGLTIQAIGIKIVNLSVAVNFYV